MKKIFSKLKIKPGILIKEEVSSWFFRLPKISDKELMCRKWRKDQENLPLMYSHRLAIS